MISFDPEILKSNDVRGIYPDQFDDDFARLLGRALPQVLPAERVAVGYDARMSSPPLYASIVAGLKEAGAEVGLLDMCPTELLYYVLGRSDEFDLGVMVTASHNPPRYNGLKLCGASAQPVGSEALKRLLDHVELDESRPAVEPDEAPAQTLSAGPLYLQYALRRVDLPGTVPDMKVVVDPGNGVAGVMWKLIAEKTGVEPLKMNFEPDGNFPAHLPDTSKAKNLEALRQAVTDSGARLGLAYDGDSDRVAVVTADGSIMQAEEVAVALGNRVLEGKRDGRIALSMAASRNVLDALREQGRPPVLVPVGHSKVKSALRANEDVAFAAESSGHFYYREFFCCDSTLLTTLHLLALAEAGKLQETTQGLQQGWRRPRAQPSFHYADPDKARAACLRAARQMLSRYADPREIICERDGAIHRHCVPQDVESADGVRVDYADWWFCVRPSGTEPKVRLSVESRDEPALQRRMAEIEDLFQGAP